VPVRGNRACRAGDGLIRRMAVRRGEPRTVERVARAIVVEPVLAGLEALDDRMSAPLGMSRRVLARRVVAATDVPTCSAATQVKPPARTITSKAIRAASAARRDRRVNLLGVRAHRN